MGYSFKRKKNELQLLMLLRKNLDESNQKQTKYGINE